MAPDSQHSSPGPSSAPADKQPSLPHRQRPPLKDILLDQYVTRDLLHTAALVDQQEKVRDLSISQSHHWAEFYKSIRGEYRQWFPPSRLYGDGYNGYGNGHTDSKPGLLYPTQKPRLGHKKTAPLKIKRKDMKQQAEQLEELVPIRLDVEWDKIKLRDTFTWNMHDRVVPPKLFVDQMVEDLGLMQPVAEPVADQIMHQLREQLTDFYPHVYIEEDALDPELPYSAYKNDEMRILIKLNITIGPLTLVDQFEWEINNPLNSPEEFARSMTTELSLSGEFTTAIAHCIREQSQLFMRSLYIVGHPFDGRPLEDADLVAAFLPTPLPSVFRPQQQAKEYAPYLYELNDADLERNELVFSREQRRQKRSVNRRGGPTLPDLKERQRTIRTLIVSSVIPGTAESMEESRIFKRPTGVSGRGKRPGAGARDDLSDSDDSDGSAPDSPALSQLQGTARTRNMRGAATAAQQRMANLGRSETPELSALHHHETRTSARRVGGRDLREESMDVPQSKIVVLKINRDKFRQYLSDQKKGIRPQHLQQTPSFGQHTRSQSALSDRGTPTAGAMGPPSTPGPSAHSAIKRNVSGHTPGQASHGAGQQAPKTAQIGRVEAPPPPPAGQTPLIAVRFSPRLRQRQHFS